MDEGEPLRRENNMCKLLWGERSKTHKKNGRKDLLQDGKAVEGKTGQKETLTWTEKEKRNASAVIGGGSDWGGGGPSEERGGGVREESGTGRGPVRQGV